MKTVPTPWHRSNPERAREQNIRSYRKHRSARIAAMKDYRKRNLSKCNDMDRRWRENNRERYRKSKLAWRNSNLGSARASSSKHYANNKAAIRAKHKAYYEANRATFLARFAARKLANPEKERARLRDHYQRNKSSYKSKQQKRRALQVGATINLKGIKAFISAVKRSNRVRCYYCNNWTPTHGCHFDHIVPLSRGGIHSADNLCATCPSCNWAKSDKLLSEWVKSGQQVLPI